MSENFDKLNTAYQMLQYDIYAKKMVANVRCLLKQEPAKDFIDNDFQAGELVYLLAATYECQFLHSLTSISGSLIYAVSCKLHW